MAEIGTIKNPIIPVPESITQKKQENSIYMARFFLDYYSDFQYSEGSEAAELSDLKYEKNSDYFCSNVYSNPFLKINEIKIALFLYSRFNSRYFLGEVFSVSRKNIRRNKNGLGGGINVGELGYIVIGHEDAPSKEAIFEFDEVECLTDLVRCELDIRISESRLVEVLKILHSFSYITMTNINWYNTKSGVEYLREMLKSSYYDLDDVRGFISGRSVLKYIRICKRMVHSDMSYHWLLKARITDNS